MDNECACRTDRAAHNRSSPRADSLFHLASVHIAPPNKPCAAVRLHVLDGRNNHLSDEKHVGSLVLGYLTVGDHAIEDLPSMLAPESTPVL